MVPTQRAPAEIREMVAVLLAKKGTRAAAELGVSKLTVFKTAADFPISRGSLAVLKEEFARRNGVPS